VKANIGASKKKLMNLPRGNLSAPFLLSFASFIAFLVSSRPLRLKAFALGLQDYSTDLGEHQCCGLRLVGMARWF
jgi:hypothetical protein